MVKFHGFRFIVVGLYRFPSANSKVFIDRLHTVINFLSKKCDEIISTGDIVFDVLIYSKDHRLLKNMLRSQNMKYLIDFQPE